MTSRWVLGAAAALAIAGATVLSGQGGRQPSPAGTASTEVRGKYAAGRGGEGASYTGGKWIEIRYSRPIKRGRDLWGSGASYGKTLNDSAPVWRAGANESTRLRTEIPLVINGTRVAPGEYTLFIDLKPNNWTLIVTTWKASSAFPSNSKDALWGAFDYTPARDVVRAPMKLETLPHSVDQLTWEFLDVTDAGGALALSWDKVLANVPFQIG